MGFNRGYERMNPCSVHERTYVVRRGFVNHPEINHLLVLSLTAVAQFQVRSIECKRQSVKEVNEGQSATFAVRTTNRRVALRRSTFRKVRGLRRPKRRRSNPPLIQLYRRTYQVADEGIF